MNTDTTTINDAGQMPAPTSARVELPTQAAVDAVGIELELGEARLVLAALSRMIGRGHSKSRDKVSQMINGLVACCLVEGIRDGSPFEAAHPELRRYGWRAGATAMRMIGIDHLVLERYWRKARRYATDACLPLHWVLAFVPAEVWPAVLTLIRWGPAMTGERLEDAVFEMAEQPLLVQTRRRKEGATLSAGTINTRVTGLLQLCDELVILNTRASTSRDPGLPLDLLAAWTFKPARPSVEECGAVWAQVDTAGPSLEEVRELLQRLERDLRRARPTLRYWILRRLVLAGLLSVHGQRVEAIHALDVDDYRPAHNFGDGTIGPAIVYYPGKTRAHDEPHILAVPEELARWIEMWIEYTGRRIGQPNSPMWPNRKPKVRRPILRLNASAFARLVSGHQANDGTGSLPLIRRGEDRYIGYNAHSYRHTCYSLMRRAGARAKRMQAAEYVVQTADDFARSVVGHDLVRGMGDVYRDIEGQQQHLARVAIGYAWDDLRHHPDAFGPDPEAINAACERVEFLTSELDELRNQLRQLEARQRTLTAARLRLAGDALAAAALESNSLVFELSAVQSLIAATSSYLDEARHDLERAREEVVAITHLDGDDYQERRTQAFTRAHAALAAATPAVALTVRDVAAVLGTTTQTVNAWIRNGFPRGRCPIWYEGAWTTGATGVRSIDLRAVDQAALTPIQRQRLLVMQLRLQHQVADAA